MSVPPLDLDPVVGSTIATIKAYVCTTCGKQYQRNTHLRRHEATHYTSNRFKCPYCEKDFARGDVCRKHIQVCPRKDASASHIIPDQRRGRKPAACKGCFHSKVSCDANRPCSRCIARKITCTPRDGFEIGSGIESIRSLSEAAFRANILASPLAEMPFLRGIFNPNRSTMLDYLDTNNNDNAVTDDVPELGQNVQSHFEKEQSVMDFDDIMSIFPSDFTSMLNQAVYNFMPDSEDGDFEMLSLSDSSPIPIFTDGGFELLGARSASLIEELYNLHCDLTTSGAPYSSAFDLAEASSVFRAENLRTFAATFFRLTHVHFPIIHYPTFGTTETSKTLLLSVVMSGALRSSPLNDALAARRYTRLAEEYIFGFIDRSITSPAVLPPPMEVLQALQAGVIILYVLLVGNHAPSANRGRSLRLPKLMSAIRHFRLTSTRHVPGLDWNTFIYNETCIRISTWTAIVDWKYSGVFYHPPAMTVGEMKCNLPLPRELWNALDAAAYIVEKDKLESSKVGPLPKMTGSLKDLISALMSDNWTYEATLSPAVLPMESLYMASIAICGIATTACQMGTLECSGACLLRAITRWHELWDQITSTIDNKTLLRTGLVRHAGENCTLARTVIQARLAGVDHPYFQSIGHDTTQALFSFLAQVPVLASSPN